jgi:hypothetical protein
LRNLNGVPNDLPVPASGDDGRQLALDLDQDLSFPPAETSLDIFEREVRGKELLLELARALGEQRAAIDILLFRKSLLKD